METRGGEKQLGWDMGITILSLNLHAYDQTGLTLHLLPDYRVYEAAVWKQKPVNQSNGQLSKGAGELVMPWSPLAHCLNIADTKTCPCTFLPARWSANITQLFNSSCHHGLEETFPHGNKSAILLPDDLSMGKSVPSTGGEFCLTLWAVIGREKEGIALVWSSLI